VVTDVTPDPTSSTDANVRPARLGAANDPGP
jgi:hypothetical protein